MHKRQTKPAPFDGVLAYDEMRLFALLHACAIRPLLDRNLCDPSCVAAAFEMGGEELVHYLSGHVGVDETAWHDEHVGIVVLTDEVGDFRNPAQAGADALVLVQRHRNAFT